jgi:hypothetical protein
MLVHEDVVWANQSVVTRFGASQCLDSLRWFSRGASAGGANEKLCICAVWGSSGRPLLSPGILAARRVVFLVFLQMSTAGAGPAPRRTAAQSVVLVLVVARGRRPLLAWVVQWFSLCRWLTTANRRRPRRRNLDPSPLTNRTTSNLARKVSRDSRGGRAGY